MIRAVIHVDNSQTAVKKKHYKDLGIAHIINSRAYKYFQNIVNNDIFNIVTYCDIL